MALIEIKNKFSRSVLLSGEAENLKKFLEKNRGADFRGADLEGADLRGAYLRGADLRGADLRGAYLRGAYLKGADLEGADLRGAYLRGADLRGAYLRGADLRGADLEGADLRGADLRGADLRGADLEGADLRGADLGCADLGDGFRYSINGNDYIQKTIPIQIFLTHYIVIIFKETIQIGCKHYKISEWETFNNDEIDNMDKGKSLEWWGKYKEMIINLAKGQ